MSVERRVVYCSPKCFYLAVPGLPQRQPQQGKLELGFFAIASDISFVLLSFIIIKSLSLLFLPVFVVVLLLCAKLNWPLRCTKDANFGDLPSRSPSLSIVLRPVGIVCSVYCS